MAPPPAAREDKDVNAQIDDLLGNTNTAWSQPWPVRQARTSSAEGSQAAAVAAADFTDIVSRGPVDIPRQQEAHDRLLRTALSHSMPEREPASRVAQATRQGLAKEIRGCASPPMDWSLQASVRFASPEPLRVVRDGLQAPTAEVSRALRAFAAGGSTEGLSLQERYQHSLLTWSFPVSRLEPADIAALSKSGSAVVQQRWEAFFNAFLGVFSQLRSGLCAAFYLVSPEGARSGFAALFRAPGQCGHAEASAVVSRSTEGLRSLMQGEGYRLGFSAPLLEHGPGDRGGSDAATLDAADAKLLRKDAGAAAQHDNKARSLLFFSGMEQVAGLHDFLANEGPTLWGRGYDVPMILAPVAFEGASVSRLGPWVTSTHGTDGAAAEHRAEYTGLIPPWCVDRLRLCIEESQRGAPGHERAAVTMRCAATPLSANLNFMPSEPAEAPAAPSPTGCFGPGCCTIEEQWRWSEPRVAAGSALVSEVKCNAGGSYDIVLRSVPGIQ